MDSNCFNDTESNMAANSNQCDELNFNKDKNAERTVHTTILNGTPIATLNVDGADMLCLAQISATILSEFSYNEIHNRRVALSIATKPCTASQMELLRCAGAVPPSSRRCGLITRHEADRLVRSFTEGTRPPNLPPGFCFNVGHECGWGCRGRFYVEKYTSSRAKCIECVGCDEVLAPNKFIFHSHRPENAVINETTFRPADAANFNSWRRHIFLVETDQEELEINEAWEDVKALFNGGNRQNVNVLTMTTLVSASAGTNTSGSNGSLSSGPATTGQKRQRAGCSSSPLPSKTAKRQQGDHSKTDFRSKSAKNRRSLELPSSEETNSQQDALQPSDVLPNILGDSFAASLSQLTSPIPTVQAPTTNLWLIDALVKSLVNTQALSAGSQATFNDLQTASSCMTGNAASLAPGCNEQTAVNLVKQKWPPLPLCNDLSPNYLLLAKQAAAAAAAASANTDNMERPSTSAAAAHFLMKNLVNMDDNCN